MSLRTANILLPELKDGAHNITITAVTYIPEGISKTGNEYAEGYDFEFKLADRTITNRFIDKSFSIAVSHLKKQLKFDKPVNPIVDKKTGEVVQTAEEVWLNSLITAKTPVTLYVEHKSVPLRNGTMGNVVNYGFLPALPPAPVRPQADLKEFGLEEFK